MDINESIKNRIPYTGFDESTYYTQKLYDFWVDNYADPDIYFKIKVLGFYKQKYKWTEDQAWEFINNNLEESRGYFVGDKFYAYDWGAGRNKVTTDKMHVPHLDHTHVRSKGGANTHENMRIRSARLNENKGDTTTNDERVATIIDQARDIDSKESLMYVIEELTRLQEAL